MYAFCRKENYSVWISPSGASRDPVNFAASKLFKPGTRDVFRSIRRKLLLKVLGQSGGGKTTARSGPGLTVSSGLVHNVCQLVFMEHVSCWNDSSGLPRYSEAVDIFQTDPGLNV